MPSKVSIQLEPDDGGRCQGSGGQGGPNDPALRGAGEGTDGQGGQSSGGQGGQVAGGGQAQSGPNDPALLLVFNDSCIVVRRRDIHCLT